MKSVMKHDFSKVPQANIPRSAFNRSHGYKTTLNAGDLVPFFVDEALPGDTFRMNATIFARLATPIVPIIDNLRMDTFYFAVPLRLLWNNFKKFMGEQNNPGDSTDYLIPQVPAPAGGIVTGGLGDYFGLPLGIENFTVNALPFRAYNMIWNEFFRDQNLQDRKTESKDDGPDNLNIYTLQKRGKRHDYFTSCLPWPQKGEGVEIPIGDKAYLTHDVGPGATNLGVWSTQASTYQQMGASTTSLESSTNLSNETDALYADLSTASATTINSLRTAFQLQKFLERDARGGTRYTELVRSHFGVVSPDARLQRPEYLGGGSVPVQINAVQQTSETGATTPQGNLAAFGTVASKSNGFTKSFTEHCIIIGLVNVRADLSYQQGIPKMFSRSTREDFYFPVFSHLGEQAVLQKEIFASGVPAEDDLVFGYQERYAEYRYYPSKITGKLRSTDAQSLDVWHLAEEFATAPTLSADFIQSDPPIDRVIAVTDEPHFIFDSYINMKCVRPMPTYSVPGLIDHF